ncbi:unnamed protein product [Dimorphilus gyrociliatus]|uniref:SOCS box domain-containing protein n=1 Tax=Dimorphilus gyrociliatus TaxID=2664684 RepID=A0A7I8VTC3_9ANNE|nr:unnamed protein product [Dimorphilus gyrociliatus]
MDTILSTLRLRKKVRRSELENVEEFLSSNESLRKLDFDTFCSKAFYWYCFPRKPGLESRYFFRKQNFCMPKILQPDGASGDHLVLKLNRKRQLKIRDVRKTNSKLAGHLLNVDGTRYQLPKTFRPDSCVTCTTLAARDNLYVFECHKRSNTGPVVDQRLQRIILARFINDSIQLIGDLELALSNQSHHIDIALIAPDLKSVLLITSQKVYLNEDEQAYPRVGAVNILGHAGKIPLYTTALWTDEAVRNRRIFAYDNRFPNNVVYSFSKNYIQCYDFVTDKVIQKGQLPNEILLRDYRVVQVTTSASGRLVSLQIFSCSPNIVKNMTLIISTKDLQAILSIKYHEICPNHLIYWNTSYFPIFSECDSLIALTASQRSNDDKRKPDIVVFKLPVIMESLKSLCRRKVIRTFRLSRIEKLGLPSKLVKFLKNEH